MAGPLSAAGILTAVRNGYPDGLVPAADFVAIVAFLRQRFTVDEVATIGAELVVRGSHALTGCDLRAVLPTLSLDTLPAADVERVAAHLRSGGWPG